MRKILMMLLVLAMTVCGAVGIAACGKDPDPEQNQGQVEQEKEKEKEEEKTPEQDKGDDGEEGKGDEEGKEEQTPQKPADGKDPETPEEQKPNPENPKDEEQKEEDKQDEEDKKDDKEEEPPQGDDSDADEPGTEPDDEPGKPETKPDNPTKPDDKPQPEPEEPPKEEPEEPKKECQHVWTYTFYDQNLASRHVKKCSKCGYSESEKCTFDQGVTVDPTCTEDGYTKYTCSVCKNFFKSYKYVNGKLTNLKTGHKLETEWKHIDGSVPNQHERKCTNPNCTYSEKENCNFNVTTLEPTCTEKGGTEQICKECNFKQDLYNSSSAALGHDLRYDVLSGNRHQQVCQRKGCTYKADTETCTLKTEEKDATCTEDGYKKSVCTVCSAVREDEVKKAAHLYTTSNFCDRCEHDGLKCETGRFGGFSNKNKVVYSSELVNVKIIVIGENYSCGKPDVIDFGAFKNYSNLEKIFIPGDFFGIATSAFEGTKINTIYFGGDQDRWNKIFADGNPSDRIEDTLKAKYPTITVSCNKNAEEVKKEIKSDTATVAALPAGDNKRLYA